MSCSIWRPFVLWTTDCTILIYDQSHTLSRPQISLQASCLNRLEVAGATGNRLHSLRRHAMLLSEVDWEFFRSRICGVAQENVYTGLVETIVGSFGSYILRSTRPFHLSLYGLVCHGHVLPNRQDQRTPHETSGGGTAHPVPSGRIGQVLDASQRMGRVSGGIGCCGSLILALLNSKSSSGFALRCSNSSTLQL